jgi:hypothetical protein
VNAQAHRQPDALVHCQPCRQRSHGGEYLQPCPHRPLGIVFVRLRIAKVHQQAVAKVLGNGALKALDHVGAGGLIGAHYLAVVFRVEFPGQDSRVHQITKQHCELPAFRLRGTL